MKNLKISIVTILLIFATVSCEDYLAPSPLSFFTPENIYVDRAGMETVLVTLRRGLRNEYYGDHKLMCIENYGAETAICTGENQEIHNWNIQVTPTSSGSPTLIRNFFVLAYEQIRNANTIISRIDEPSWESEADKNAILAEAYFHRAYWYYRLVNQFGDVPFLNKEYNTPKIDYVTHSRQTILDKIQSDLEFSVNWLPRDVNQGKVNRGAGYHLLTKVYLANCQFQKAVEAASTVIDGGDFKLMTERFGLYASDPKYNLIYDLHQVENKSLAENKEGILVAQDKFGTPGASTNGTNTMRDYLPFWSHASYLKDPDGLMGMIQPNFDPQLVAFGRGVGIVKPSPYSNFEIWSNYGSDLRRDTVVNWMSRAKILYNNPESKYFGTPVQIQFSNPRDTLRSYYEWPAYKLYVKNEPTVGQPIGGNGDWYIFRLAETYLLRAEAYCWLNDFENAAADINKIRARANASLITAGQASIEYVLDERVRELFAEEPRKTELTRIAFIMARLNLRGYSLDNFADKNYWYDRQMEKNLYNKGFEWGANAYEISSYHVLWPIPQDVIDANTGNVINQNRHYPGFENNITPLTVISDE
ncbi:MAG: RagB/SusD family nutrient uptake outer membrane protein [Tannerella sp.]|jgi:hypothetical protein|nr:RagB/SusD family nutrient uptake outer membrane protein [Tannerella sp.]